MKIFNLWRLDPPVKWKAGSTSDKGDFFFDCADCGAKEPEIAGIISTDGTYNGIGLLGDINDPLPISGKPGLRPAMFCKECFETRLAGKPPRAWNPPPPPSWPHIKHHLPGHFSGKVRIRQLENHLEDKPRWEFARDWDKFNAALRRRLQRVLRRHLERGGSIIEGQRTEWRVTKNNCAEWIADHVTKRVVGFGWYLALEKAQ